LAGALLHAKLAGRLQFLYDALDAALIQQAAAQRNIEPTDEELQAAADEFRAARELYDTETTEAWLANHFLSYADWEALLAHEVVTNKLRDAVTADQIEPHFASNRLNYDTAAISEIVVKDEDVARELRAQITDDGADFHARARTFSLDETTRLAGGYAGLVRRPDMEAEIEAAVFGAHTDAVLGPFKTDRGWLLVKVERQQRATLDAAMRETVKAELFAEWLTERRRKARVRYTLLEAVIAADDQESEEETDEAMVAEAAGAEE
ncbi:MAG TPA: peptidylprolyl isomerase, partial [Pyrinomonadaceae bacterium]|nr:peptidylprolyl isomerase [Pyrinomonadaceae bacterium]